MKIIYKSGDVTKATEKVIVHGCNAQHKFNAGVAKAIRHAFPEAYEAYMDEAKLPLGHTIWVPVKNKIIINGISQKYYGRTPGVRYVDYNAVQTILKTIDMYVEFGCQDYGDLGPAVAMPKIGCSLGGGKWEDVEPIIERTLVHIQPVVYLG